MKILVDTFLGNRPVCQPVDLGNLPDYYMLMERTSWRQSITDVILEIQSRRLNRCSHEELVKKCLDMMSEGMISLDDMSDPDLFEFMTDLSKQDTTPPSVYPDRS